MVYTLQTRNSLATQVRTVACCCQTILISGWDIHKVNRDAFYWGNLLFIRDQIRHPSEHLWTNMLNGLSTSTSLQKGSNPPPPWTNMLNEWFINFHLSSKGIKSPIPLNTYVEWFMNFQIKSPTPLNRYVDWFISLHFSSWGIKSATPFELQLTSGTVQT